jgi:hypothetical protein
MGQLKIVSAWSVRGTRVPRIDVSSVLLLLLLSLWTLLRWDETGLVWTRMAGFLSHASSELEL